MARSTMDDLIARLRGMVNAGTADYTISSVSYWSDDRLEEVLDRHRVEIIEELLRAEPRAEAGTVAWYDYYSRFMQFEKTDGGTAVFRVEQADGTDKGTATWTADYQRGQITFGADQEGSSFYLTGRSYDLNGAAADVWRQKAAHFTEHYTFSTDNHKLDRGQIIENCLKMSSHYAAKARPSIVTLES